MNQPLRSKHENSYDNFSSLNKNFTWSLESTQKENTQVLSNYSSCNPSNVPKEILEKTIELKNQHINELMEELKQAKASYEEFKIKLSEENTKIKDENHLLKQKFEPLIKEKDYLKKCIIKLEQEKSLQNEKLQSFQQESQLTISELNKKIGQLQEENKKIQKTLIHQEKISNQLKQEKDEIEHKNVILQKEIEKLKNEESLEIKRLKENELKLNQENAKLKEQLEKFEEKKKTTKKYDKKLSRIEEKIVNIIENI